MIIGKKRAVSIQSTHPQTSAVSHIMNVMSAPIS